MNFNNVLIWSLNIYAFLSSINKVIYSNYTATCLPSRKLSKLEEPDMQDTAGEAGTSS